MRFVQADNGEGNDDQQAPVMEAYFLFKRTSGEGGITPNGGQLCGSQVLFLFPWQPKRGITGADAVEFEVDVMLIRGALHKKLYATIQIDRGTII